MNTTATHLLIFRLMAGYESAEFLRETFHKAQNHGRFETFGNFTLDGSRVIFLM